MHLAGDQERIDDGTEVVDGGVSYHPGVTGLRVDLHLGDVAAIGEGRRHRLVADMIDVERGRHAGR